MDTIRRVYVYLTAFISLEVVIWGLIGLARFILGGGLIGGKVNQLASGLALTAVGVPVFLLHWWLAERRHQTRDEHFSRLRALFLYGGLLATLVPITQNLLAFINRTLLLVLGLPVRLVFVGEGQTWIDNIVAILVNGLIAFFLFSVLRRDLLAKPQEHPVYRHSYNEIRRLYGYIWLLYGLAMVVGGVQQVLFTLLNIFASIGTGIGANLAGGLSLLLVGIPLWVYTGRLIGQRLGDPEEARAILRLVVLYALNFSGVGGVLIPTVLVLDVLFRLLLGETMDLPGVLTKISGPISAAVPFGVMWFFYGRRLSTEIAALPDTPRRTGLRRIYYYVLSAVGLVTVFFGLHSLLSFIVDVLLRTEAIAEVFRQRISLALATLTVSLPLWYLTWRSMAAEASVEGEDGDHARRSLVRKIYLYLVVFAGVIGVMVSGGSLIFQVISKLLGEPAVDFQRTSWILAELLVLFALFLAYHLAILGADGRLAAQTLAERHEDFPVLVLAKELDEFTEQILESIQQETPTLPAAVHLVGGGIPDETLSAARAVILPGQIAASPSEAIRIWLQDFNGIRLVVPTEAEGWKWIFGSGRSLSSLAVQTAKQIRYLAEGEEAPKISELSVWNVIVTILAVFVGIPLIIVLVAALGDLFT